MFRVIMINTCLAILLTSCGGTFSYKRGARPEALTSAQTTCKASGKQDKKTMEQCLEAQGWSVYQLDDMELFAEASESTEGLGGRAVDSAFVTVEETKTEESTPQTATETKQPATTQAAPQTVSKAQTTTAPTKEVKTAPAKAAKKEAPSPYTTYKVSSWWQWGAGQQALERDLAACESTLGEKHKPDFSKQLVTRGFVVCMYQKGWKALKSK